MGKAEENPKDREIMQEDADETGVENGQLIEVWIGSRGVVAACAESASAVR